jgi:hypothetical protein
MGEKGSSGAPPDVVYVVLERTIAMDLLNALYIALGIMPRGGNEGQGDDGGTLEGKGGGVKRELGRSKSGGGKSGGNKPKGVKAVGSRGAGKGR